jgi:hypothetical protein
MKKKEEEEEEEEEEREKKKNGRIWNEEEADNHGGKAYSLVTVPELYCSASLKRRNDGLRDVRGVDRPLAGEPSSYTTEAGGDRSTGPAAARESATEGTFTGPWTPRPAAANAWRFSGDVTCSDGRRGTLPTASTSPSSLSSGGAYGVVGLKMPKGPSAVRGDGTDGRRTAPLPPAPPACTVPPAPKPRP